MAAGVIGQHAVEVRAHVGDAQHIDQKLGQLEGGGGQKSRRGAIAFVIPVRRAGCRSGWSSSCNCRSARRPHRPVRCAPAARRCRRSAAPADRLVPVAGVEGGLAAAGLLLWKDHLDALPLQQFDRRHAHFRVDHVDHAGDKQRHAPRRRCRTCLFVRHHHKIFANLQCRDSRENAISLFLRSSEIWRFPSMSRFRSAAAASSLRRDLRRQAVDLAADAQPPARPGCRQSRKWADRCPARW
jgi:hypothetical protein